MTAPPATNGTGNQFTRVIIGTLVIVVAAVLFIVGLTSASTTVYIVGLCLFPVGLAVLLSQVRVLRRVPAVAGVLVLTGAAIITPGVLVPINMLDAEFTGTNVAWRVDGVDTTLQVAAVTEELVALRGGSDMVLYDRADGRRLAETRIDFSDSVLGAGTGILVEPAPGADPKYRLYATDGSLTWEYPAVGRYLSRALAHADGITVLELCDTDGCSRKGINSTGAVTWETEPAAYTGPRSFPLPRAQGSLPSYALWPIPEPGAVPNAACGCLWRFAAAADGNVLYTGHGRQGYVVENAGHAAFVVTDVDEARQPTYEISGPSGSSVTGLLPERASTGYPIGPYLAFSLGWTSVLLDTRPEASVREVQDNRSLPTGPADIYGANELGLTDAGVLTAGSPGIEFTAFGAKSPTWTRPSEGYESGVVIGTNSAAVILPLARTNPMDQGYSKITDTRDRRVTVLNTADGGTIGEVRTHWRPRVTPVPGGAIVQDSTVMMLIGK